MFYDNKNSIVGCSGNSLAITIGTSFYLMSTYRLYINT